MSNVSGTGGSQGPIQINGQYVVANTSKENITEAVKLAVQNHFKTQDIQVTCTSQEETDPSKFEVVADGQKYTATANKVTNTATNILFTVSLDRAQAPPKAFLVGIIFPIPAEEKDLQNAIINALIRTEGSIFTKNAKVTFDKDKPEVTVLSEKGTHKYSLKKSENGHVLNIQRLSSDFNLVSPKKELAAADSANQQPLFTTKLSEEDSTLLTTFTSEISTSANNPFQDYPKGKTQSLLRMVKNFCRQFFGHVDSHNKSVYKSLIKHIESTLSDDKPRTRLQLGLIGYRAFLDHNTPSFSLDQLKIVEKSFIRGSLPKDLKKAYDNLSPDQRIQFIKQLEPYVNLDIADFKKTCSSLFKEIPQKQDPETLVKSFDGALGFLYNRLNEHQKRDSLALLSLIHPPSSISARVGQSNQANQQLLLQIQELPKYKENGFTGFVTGKPVKKSENPLPNQEERELALAILQNKQPPTESTLGTAIEDLTRALNPRR